MRVKVAILAFLGLALISSGLAILRRAPAVPLPPLRVEVLNGCGEAGLAARVSSRLRTLGQDVVLVDDATHHGYAWTVLIDRQGRPDLTRRLAQALGGPQVILEREATPEADVTLILGADYARFRLGQRHP